MITASVMKELKARPKNIKYIFKSVARINIGLTNIACSIRHIKLNVITVYVITLSQYYQIEGW